MFGPVGHTHGPLDQRFSILCTALASAPVLQCPKASAVSMSFDCIAFLNSSHDLIPEGLCGVH